MTTMKVLLWSCLTAFTTAFTAPTRPHTTSLHATVAPVETSLQERVLQTIENGKAEALEYADMFDLGTSDAALYAYFAAIRQVVPLNLQGKPFLLRRDQLEAAWQGDLQWQRCFTDQDLQKATEDDFLDAARGSTDNRQGWKVTDVSVPRGQSFEEARMTYDDVQTALEKGTVIFNAAGAHIPKLAGPCLACSDATWLPCALNLYVTGPQMRTSAPPHTDKQDVAVIQSTGRKHWKVYSPAVNHPTADLFARGKGDDALPLHRLGDMGCELLLEATLQPGDVLFVPASFPHTTSTVVDDDDNDETAETSIHLTLNIDHHVWELDYLSCRRLALRRAGVTDAVLGQSRPEENRYDGPVNALSYDLKAELFRELPLGLLDEAVDASTIEEVASELERISKAVDTTSASLVDASIWKETIDRVRRQGMELLEIHRDMYLAALEEGRTRIEEDAMMAHLGSPTTTLTPERMQRLSVFRVKRYYDQIDASKKALEEWSYAGKAAAGDDALPTDWAFTLPVKVGDQVEADLGGAFFPATVARATGGSYDVNFFDGDRETGLDRSQIKLLVPPKEKKGKKAKKIKGKKQ